MTPEEHPEPPDGEASAEKAQRLWIPRALRQTSYVSHMAREVCEDSTQADWGVWAYREYRRLLDEEMTAACQIYAEVELADLPVREGKEAQGWLTSAHQDAERAREHIGEHIRKREGLRALLYPDVEDSSPRTQQRRVRGRAFLEAPARNPGNKPRWRQPGLYCWHPGQRGRQGGLSWRKKRTLGPRRREAASKVTLPARARPAEPKRNWWTQPASPTLQTRGECRSFSGVPQAWAPAH